MSERPTHGQKRPERFCRLGNIGYFCAEKLCFKTEELHPLPLEAETKRHGGQSVRRLQRPLRLQGNEKLMTQNNTNEPDIDTSDVIRGIADLWNLLSDDERTAVRSTLRVQAYRKNELIYQEGENPDHLLCLLSGKVKIFRDGVGGRSQIMRLMRPGQYFGYRASLAHEPYVTAAAAFEPSLVCAIPMPVITAAMENNNALCRFFVGELATDLGISDRRTVSLTQKHIRGRLAESLLFLMETYGCEPDTKTLDIRLSREDLAHLSNMTTSNAIRTLSNFAAEGLLRIEGRRITVCDEKMLQRISRIG